MHNHYHRTGFGQGAGPGFGPGVGSGHAQAGCRRLHGDFGRGGFRHPFPMGGHPHGFGGRARRGDMRLAVLRLLAEQPMHGYQIIQELSERSGGAWSPSAGSVYPTLQLLADEGLIVAEETAGKKVYSLTDAGKAAEAQSKEQPAPWETAAGGDRTGAAGLREAGARLMHAIVQIAKTGTPEQVSAAAEILVDARKKLYAILAEE